jgi:hypothetical protein
MPLVGFEPMIPMFERENGFRALGRAAIVIGQFISKLFKFWTDRHKTGSSRARVYATSRVDSIEHG